MHEYILVSDFSILKSNGLDCEELALVEPLVIGADAIRRACIEK
jgi:threonine dehydrogenase-like Zn-dependent dehydrogenase